MHRTSPRLGCGRWGVLDLIGRSLSSSTGLQATHAFSKKLVKAITSATQKLPYALRWITREMLLSLRVRRTGSSSAPVRELIISLHRSQRRFPDISDATAALVLGRFIFLRVIKPAIL